MICHKTETNGPCLKIIFCKTEIFGTCYNIVCHKTEIYGTRSNIVCCKQEMVRFPILIVAIRDIFSAFQYCLS